MELPDFSFYGRVFHVKVDSDSGYVRINCAVPAGVVPKLDRVFGSRFLWYDLYTGGSTTAVAGDCRYTGLRQSRHLVAGMAASLGDLENQPAVPAVLVLYKLIRVPRPRAHFTCVCVYAYTYFTLCAQT
ncbi:hypothetical protein VOLCADRAFT_107696 [Volvox carteri f. nagariensis]|uniref:Uncharacterized protein n=1 Tax=Volvox carteri f. nagariensis TaxID=3068 RepID=D8UFP9_VOLCA|nr:uncharacterized protein VOLCADRAFT_107696 [Volvox carteri f. nagariensis]EFJ41377.1 hypothetical protein VOLCADRAFT_107696 [Volvox carteri f. nagariensis]|eukprot:XP_002957483.1 hypothetical protein VOLCADRAFT_107696 [Volvox carteri f. nagariensis]